MKDIVINHSLTLQSCDW